MLTRTCDMDGCWTDPITDREIYWHCEERAVDTLGGMHLCPKHFKEMQEDDD